jgi:hypothetical protein
VIELRLELLQPFGGEVDGLVVHRSYPSYELGWIAVEPRQTPRHRGVTVTVLPGIG